MQHPSLHFHGICRCGLWKATRIRSPEAGTPNGIGVFIRSETQASTPALGQQVMLSTVLSCNTRPSPGLRNSGAMVLDFSAPEHEPNKHLFLYKLAGIGYSVAATDEDSMLFLM